MRAAAGEDAAADVGGKAAPAGATGATGKKGREARQRQHKATAEPEKESTRQAGSKRGRGLGTAPAAAAAQEQHDPNIPAAAGAAAAAEATAAGSGTECPVAKRKQPARRMPAAERCGECAACENVATSKQACERRDEWLAGTWRRPDRPAAAAEK